MSRRTQPLGEAASALRQRVDDAQTLSDVGAVCTDVMPAILRGEITATEGNRISGAADQRIRELRNQGTAPGHR